MEEENQNNNSVSNEKTTHFNVSTGENIERKGKKKTALSVIAIILIIAMVVGLIYYFTIYTKPDQMYKRLVGSSIDSYTVGIKNMNYKTSKTSFKLDADLDTDKINKNVTDLINKIKLGMEVQTDNEDKQVLMNLKADYEQEDLLELQMYSDIDKEKTYMQFKNFLEKYMEVENMEDEFYTYFEEILEQQKMTGAEKKSLQKACNIVKKELTSAIKEEYCTAEKEDITVNGKTIATTKNIIKMHQKQFKEECTTIFKHLKDNKDFIDCFEDEDEIIEVLETLLDQVEELEEDEKSTIELAIYTRGIMQKVEKVTLAFDSEESEEKITIEVTKIDKNSYDFEILEESKTIGKGNVKTEEKNKEEGTIQLEIEIENFGNLKLNMEYSQKFNQDMDKIDVKDAVKSNQLTNSAQETLATNLQKSKLYEIIANISGVSNSTVSGNTDKNQPTYDILDEDEENKQETEDKKENNNDNNKEEQKVETQNNEIVSYDGKQKIIFNMPKGYQLGYTSDNYKSFDKGDTSIKISTAYGNKEEYYKDLQQKKKYYEEDSYYNNVSLSDMNTIEVKGKTFYRATLSYQYADEEAETKSETTYVWSEISEQSVVDFEIQNSNKISSQELEEILTVEIQKK